MYLSIDIGGTKTLIAAFNNRGKVVRRHKFPTPAKKTDFLNTLFDALLPFCSRHGSKIKAIVIAIPGLVENNKAVWFGNRYWKNFDIETSVKKLFTCPIYLENDASLATVYESSFHKGLTLYLTFSTGIGGGLARTKKLTKNTNSVEPGHQKYLWQGRKKEWEDIASCAAIGADYSCQATSVRGKTAYLDIASRVALGLPDLIEKYHPDTIIIGGPLGKLFRHIAKPLRADLKTELKRKKLPHLAAPKRPTESVIYGGYFYAKERAR